MQRLLALTLLIGSTASELMAQTTVRIAGIPVEGPPAQPSAAPSWGTADESILSVNAFAFDTTSSDVSHDIAPGGARFATSGDLEWIAPVSLPTGAIVTGLELQGCDLSAAGQLRVTLIRQTIIAGVEGLNSVGGGPLLTGVQALPGCEHFSFAFPAPETIVNTNAGYALDVQHSDVTNGDLRFTVVRIRYRLQVSPAPGAATFTDVPTGHPYFRFVEALAASGITAGCGGGNFCPDGTLTRGEMAVFLSAALGLHFPN